MLIVDGHEDLAWNIQTFGRDYTRPVEETRRLEAGTETPRRTGQTLLGWQEYQRGQVALVFATLFASPEKRCDKTWEPLCYKTAEEAHRLYQGQLDTYYRLVEKHPAYFQIVLDKPGLEEILKHTRSDHEDKPEESEKLGISLKRYSSRNGSSDKMDPEERQYQLDHPKGSPVGLVILMEGAEGVRSPGELDEWWARGVRIIGPAWAGTRFCGGTQEPGPLTSEGFALLEGMASLGFGLDVSHMDETAVLQAIDSYPGVILASHANAASLLRGLEGNRHLTDRVIAGLIERDGVIGVMPGNWALFPGWKPEYDRSKVTFQQLVAHIDHICQIAGDARHAALGTDFDGGFGWPAVPEEINTIADLQKLSPLLSERGYTESDIAAILGGNWIERLKRILPEAA